MSELERIRAVLLFMRTHIPIHLDGMPLIDTPEQARDYLDANRLYWLESLLAVVAAARSLTGLSDTILSLDSFEANRSCPYCEGNYIVTYEANPFVHSEDCPVILLERAVAALEDES